MEDFSFCEASQNGPENVAEPASRRAVRIVSRRSVSILKEPTRAPGTRDLRRQAAQENPTAVRPRACGFLVFMVRERHHQNGPSTRVRLPSSFSHGAVRRRPPSGSADSATGLGVRLTHCTGDRSTPPVRQPLNNGSPETSLSRLVFEFRRMRELRKNRVADGFSANRAVLFPGSTVAAASGQP